MLSRGWPTSIESDILVERPVRMSHGTENATPTPHGRQGDEYNQKKFRPNPNPKFGSCKKCRPSLCEGLAAIEGLRSRV
eukprot:3638195-Amphidinium_carterae.1